MNNIVYDMPKGWEKDAIWKKKVYTMWHCMWRRVLKHPSYRDCLIYPNFKYFSNYLKWIQNEPRFEEFQNTCHVIRWCVDKDMKNPDNRNYYPECMTLCTSSENSREQILRNPNPSIYRFRSVLGVNISNKSILLFKYMKLARAKGFNAGHIVECCKGTRKKHKSYRWYYVNYKHNRKYRVKDGDFIVKNN